MKWAFLYTVLFSMLCMHAQTSFAQSDSTATLRLHFKAKQTTLNEDQMLAIDSLFPLPDDLLVDNILLTAYIESGTTDKRTIQRAWESLAAMQAYLKAQHLDVMTYTLRVEESWKQDVPIGEQWMELRIVLKKPYAIPQPETIKDLFEEDFRKEGAQAGL